MMLIGMFDSPFVRRVAISIKLFNIPFEHANWSVGKDFAQIRKYNPLGRVPTLVLDDGATLIESAAILDYLDELAGADRALLPRAGVRRRAALKLMAIAIGAAEKGVLMVYERVFRDESMRSETWLNRCRTQVHGALLELDTHCAQLAAGEWLVGDHMTQADITAACIFTFLCDALPLTIESAPYPNLRILVARCEALPQFQSTKLAFFVPNS
jgi:glutathione S-transferase